MSYLRLIPDNILSMKVEDIDNLEDFCQENGIHEKIIECENNDNIGKPLKIYSVCESGEQVGVYDIGCTKRVAVAKYLIETCDVGMYDDFDNLTVKEALLTIFDTYSNTRKIGEARI